MPEIRQNSFNLRAPTFGLKWLSLSKLQRRLQQGIQQRTQRAAQPKPQLFVIQEDDESIEFDDSLFESDTNDDQEDRPQQRQAAVLAADDLLKKQLKIIQQAAIVLSIPFDEARALCRQYGWDLQRLLEAKYSIHQPHDNDYGHDEPLRAQQQEEEEEDIEPAACAICIEQFDNVNVVPVRLSGCPTSHAFCSSCWEQHIQFCVSISKAPTCMNTGCERSVSREFAVQHVDLDTMSRLDRLLAFEYISSRKDVRWCPAPGCNLAVSLSEFSSHSEGDHNVQCQCGFEFCFRCGNESHSPLSCELLQVWHSTFDENSNNLKWIKGFTKPCPSCRVPIEKNGGCPHHSCIHCKTIYCWDCLWIRGSDASWTHECDEQRKKNLAQLDINESDLIQTRNELGHYRDVSDKFDQISGEERTIIPKLLQQAKQSDAALASTTQQHWRWFGNEQQNAIKVLQVAKRVIKYSFIFVFLSQKANAAAAALVGYMLDDLQSDVRILFNKLKEVKVASDLDREFFEKSCRLVEKQTSRISGGIHNSLNVSAEDYQKLLTLSL